MKFMYLALFVLPLGPSMAHGQEVYPWEIRSIEAALKNGTTGIKNSSDCTKTPETSPKCAEMTDDVCTSLWSDKNKGNLKLVDGSIELGKSAKSNMSRALKADYQAMMDAYPRLPPDVKQRAKPILDELKLAFKNEKDTNEWYRSVSRLDTRWDELMEDVVEERVYKINLKLKGVPSKDLTVEQKVLYQQETNKLQDEYVKAKYAQHGNWKRIERVFDQVQQDLLAEIDELKISADRKQKMIEAVREIKLTLPVRDPNTNGYMPGCSTSVRNAFYSSEHHAFTVCAGLFNTLKSDSAIYAIVAHEIGHSIDPARMAKKEFKERSPIEQTLKKLAGDGPPKVSCEEWNQISKSLENLPKSNASTNTDEMQKLFDCLAPKAGLIAQTDDKLNSAATKIAESIVSDYATSNSFSTLAQPTITKKGVKVENEFFMRKDRLKAMYNDNTFSTLKNPEAETLDIFDQALRCEVEKIDGKEVTYANATAEQRHIPFNKAIAKTRDVIAARKRSWFEFCKTNCPEIADEKLAVSSNEDFSDWIASKALNRHLLRKSDLRERRESAASAFVLFCEGENAQADAPDLSAVEKKYSLEVHNDSRIRRLSIFNKENKEATLCNADGKDQGLGACEL